MQARTSQKYKIPQSPYLRNNKTACLTLDLEQDFAGLLERPSYEGLGHLPELIALLRAKGTPLTCFVQGSLLETHWQQVSQLYELDIEFGLHSYSHPAPGKMNFEFEISTGRETYRNVFGCYPAAYRSPMGFVNEECFRLLAENGFKYDSSIFPSFRPGVFNNLRSPIKPFLVNESGVVEFPCAVLSSFIRIPVSLSYIKLMGKPYWFLLKTMKLPNLIVSGFHLHDLFQLSSAAEIPLINYSPIHRAVLQREYLREKSGMFLLEKLIDMLGQKGYTFVKLRDVYDAIHGKDG